MIPSPKEQRIPAAENLFKALLIIALIAASFWLADWCFGLSHALKWVAIAALAVVNVVLLTGLGVLAHDAVHRVLFRSAFWNEFWGGLLSALTLNPFHANRQFHLTHHAYAHQPGLDPEEAMHRRRFPLAFALGANAALKELYTLYLKNFVRGDPKSLARTAQDTLFLAIAGGVYFVLVPALGLSIWATVVPMIIAFPPVFAFRALSDHYGLPPAPLQSRVRDDVFDTDPNTVRGREREVTGWVVHTSPWLEWLWSHVNYHEVHHKYPYLSHRYLPQVYAATSERYPYRMVHGYWRSLWELRKRSYYGT